jgi:prepilin-type N-terminal cleavage/methylation domain-containing protein
VKIKRQKNLFGFTLIEVVIVIGIIGVLTVIIFPAINEIRAKNRDAEKVSDIAAIQLALSLYYSQNSDLGYPTSLDGLDSKYLPEESKISPNANLYVYVPLKRGEGTKCTYYHLGVELELPSAQIDTADNFSSANPDAGGKVDGGYSYCGYKGPGINGVYSEDNRFMYDVRP